MFTWTFFIQFVFVYTLANSIVCCVNLRTCRVNSVDRIVWFPDGTNIQKPYHIFQRKMLNAVVRKGKNVYFILFCACYPCISCKMNSTSICILIISPSLAHMPRNSLCYPSLIFGRQKKINPIDIFALYTNFIINFGHTFVCI